MQKEHPVFIERNDVPYQFDARPGNAAFQLAENHGVDFPDTTDFFPADTLKWCAQQEMCIDNDCVGEKHM